MTLPVNGRPLSRRGVLATTAGDTCRTITIADGLTDGTYVVQGVEGVTGSTTVTVTATGFTSAVSGVINVVTPMVAFGGPNFGTPGIPATMTSLQADALHAKGARSSALAMAGAPLVRFVRFYVLKLGFLDGAAGTFRH